MEQWKGFSNGVWQKEVNVRDFILKNFTPYTGDESFLEGPTRSNNKTLGSSYGIIKERT